MTFVQLKHLYPCLPLFVASQVVPWRRQWRSTPVFLPGESQGWGSLVGCRSMGSHRVGHDWSDLAAAADTCPSVSTGELITFPWMYSSSRSMALFGPADPWPWCITRINPVLSPHSWLVVCLSNFGSGSHLGLVPVSLVPDLTQPLAPVSDFALGSWVNQERCPLPA